MPESRPGTQPLAGAREELRQAEQRLADLAQACARPCERLLAALGRLPDAARFEPFPPEPATSPAAAAASDRKQGSRRRIRGQEAAPTMTPAAPAHQPPPRGSGLPAANLAANPASNLAETAAPNPAPRPSPTTLAPQVPAVPTPSFGATVAELLARWPETPEPPPARPVAPLLPAAGTLAETPLGPIIQDIVARSIGRPTERQSAPARQFARLPAQFQAATATAAALAEWLASQAPAPAAGPDRLAPALADQGSGLLARLLAGQDPAAQNPGEPAALPRLTAPRARSRLSGERPPEAAARPPQDSPVSEPLPGEEGSELAKQLNRLLLDQAWLRGVDLT